MNDALPTLPARPIDGHKGTFGTVCVVGGNGGERMMIGGPALSALAALRSGVGLAVLAMPQPILGSALTIVPSATGLALPVDKLRQLQPSAVAELLDNYRSDFSCIAVGPGLGAGEAQQQIVMRLVGADDLPMVIDADALNALAEVPEFDRDMKAPFVLTPHPGEYRRLAERLGLPNDPVDPKKREAAAAALARRLGCVVVLKGRGTIISDGIDIYKEERGNVALATAGTGDVLTGAIAGFIAQFHKSGTGMSLLNCARWGVRIHAVAADLWAQQHGDTGLLAYELAGLLPSSIQKCRSNA